MSNLKSSSHSFPQRSTSSFSSQKRTIEDLQKKLAAKEADVNELRQTNQQAQNDLINLRQENETLLQRIKMTKFQFDSKTKELERFQYTNHLHRKTLMVQHRESLETLQCLITDKDQEIALFKNKLHEIIKKKYYECENLRHQVEMLKKKLQEITSDNLAIAKSIQSFKEVFADGRSTSLVAKQGNQHNQSANGIFTMFETAGDIIGSDTQQQSVALLMIDEKAGISKSLNPFDVYDNISMAEGQVASNNEKIVLGLAEKLNISDE